MYRMRNVLAVMTLLVVVAFSRGADDFVVPAQKIKGGEIPIPLGELVDLYVSPVEEKISNLVSSSYVWKVLEYESKTGQFHEKRFRSYKEGDRQGIFFGAGIKAKRLHIFCVATHTYLVKDGDKITGVAARSAFLSLQLQIGEDSPPDPEPGPGPGPGPGPDPKPGPIAKAWLVIIEETAEAAAGRGKLFTDTSLRKYITDKGWKQRIADKDIKDKTGVTPRDIKPYIDRASGKTLPFLFVVDQAGKVRYEGKLPDNPADLLALLRKIGG